MLQCTHPLLSTDCHGIKGTGQDSWTIWWTQECSSHGMDEAQGSRQKYAVSQVLETDKGAFWLHGQNQNYKAWPATVRNFCTVTWPMVRGGEEWVEGGNWWNLFGVCKSNVHKCIFKSVWEKQIQWRYVFSLSLTTRFFRFPFCLKRLQWFMNEWIYLVSIYRALENSYVIKALACGNEASGLNSSVQQKQPNLQVCYMVDVLPRYRVPMVTKRDLVSTIKKWT